MSPDDKAQNEGPDEDLPPLTPEAAAELARSQERAAALARQNARPVDWLACALEDIPLGVRFTVPAQGQGQTVEVAYGDFGMHEASPDDAPYKRITDHSEGPPARYFQRAGWQEDR